MADNASLLGRFVWRDLMTTDVAGSVEFYTSLFPEWSIREMDMGDGVIYRMIHAGGCDMGGMVPVEKAAGVPTHWIGYVSVADAEAAVAAAEAAGGKCVWPVCDAPGVGRFAQVADGQGACSKPFQSDSPIHPPETPADGQFCWEELLTTDAAAAKTFYQSLYGWSHSDVDMGPAGGYTLFKLGEKEVAGAMQMPAEAEAPPHWLCYVYATELDARWRKAEELGAKTFVAPTDIPDVGRFCVMGDPQGAGFAMMNSQQDG